MSMFFRSSGCFGGLPLMPFSHRPLGFEEIRLISIVPATDGHIICESKHVQLASEPAYKALSYAWGDPATPANQVIYIDGQTFNIRPNLLAALQAIQRLLEDNSNHWLWIDAICINQHNAQERGQQVPLMHHIYGQADRVLVCLGSLPNEGHMAAWTMSWLSEFHVAQRNKDPDEIVDITLAETVRYAHDLRSEALPKLAAFQEEVREDQLQALYRLIKPALLDYTNSFRDVNLSALEDPWVRATIFHPKHAIWAAFQAFFDSTWFRRVWTYQEIALAQEASVLCEGGRQCRLADGLSIRQRLLRPQMSRHHLLP